MTRVRQHWPAIAIALVIGAITAGPFLFFQMSSGYQGISLMGTDAEEHYLARMQEVYEGFPSQGNVFLPNKDVPPIEPGLGEWLQAKTGHLLLLSASAVETYGKFLLPVLIALLVYALAYTLSASRAAGVLAAAAVILGDPFISDPRALIDVFRGVASHTGFLIYSRPVSPEISALFLFGALVLIARLFFSARPEMLPSRRYASLCAITFLTGLSLYVSFYTFAFLGAIELVMFIYELVHRRYRRAIEVGAAGIGALVLAIPFVLNYLHVIADPAYATASGRFGLVLSHAPVVGMLLLLLLTAAWVLPKSLGEVRRFILIGAFALLLVLNQQVLTGRELQVGHFHWYVTRPFVGISGAVLFVALTERFVRLRVVRVVVYVVVLMVLMFGAGMVQISSYRATVPAARAAQAYAPLFTYLNHEALATVWADRTLSLYIPIYTHDDAPNNSYAEYYLVSQNYLITRMLLEYRLQGVTPTDTRTVMLRDRADISARLFGVYWRDTAGSYAAIPDALIDTYAQQYKDAYAEPLTTLFKTLGITEIVWDASVDGPGEALTKEGLQEETILGRFNIYHI